MPQEERPEGGVARSRGQSAHASEGRLRGGPAPPYPLGAPEGLLQEGPAQERFASFQAVLPHLRSGSIDAPSLIVVDDAHLADSASLLLVRFLVRERGLALLMLLTRRDRAPEAAPEV